MHKFERNLLTEWRKLDLPFNDARYLIAVSGGADSICLSYALFRLKCKNKIKTDFIIAHYNHNLRGKDSFKDAEFVKAYADNIDFKFFQAAADKGVFDNKNLEQAARAARYEFLSRTAQEYDCKYICTAHTQNDQAETLLINLIRGSGLQGLSGIKSKRILLNALNCEINLIRPLISWAEKSDILKYASDNDIGFVTDKMNFDEKFRRVSVRNKLLPFLEKYNSNIVKTLSETAEILGNENDLIDNLLNADDDFCRKFRKKELKISELKECSRAELFRGLRFWLQIKRGNLNKISNKHLEAIRNLITSRRSGKYIELPDLKKIEKSKGLLIYKNNQG